MKDYPDFLEQIIAGTFKPRLPITQTEIDHEMKESKSLKWRLKVKWIMLTLRIRELFKK